MSRNHRASSLVSLQLPSHGIDLNMATNQVHLSTQSLSINLEADYTIATKFCHC
jgi:hypothetical protein